MKILKNFIVFEGLDGSGTTTQCLLLKEALEKEGKNVFLTCEPTTNPIGKLIKDGYLKKNHSTTDRALMLLYAADREDHLENKDYGIKKQLFCGRIVISDRYFFSSIAYQGVNIPIETVRSVNEFDYPEILIYISSSVDVCLKRIDKRNGEKELFESKDYLTKTSVIFDKIFSSLPEGIKFLRLEGDRPIEENREKIFDFVIKNI